MIVRILYNKIYKLTDYVRIWAQPINEDHLRLYQLWEESQIIIESYIKKGEMSINSLKKNNNKFTNHE